MKLLYDGVNYFVENKNKLYSLEDIDTSSLEFTGLSNEESVVPKIVIQRILDNPEMESSELLNLCFPYISDVGGIPIKLIPEIRKVISTREENRSFITFSTFQSQKELNSFLLSPVKKVVLDICTDFKQGTSLILESNTSYNFQNGDCNKRGDTGSDVIEILGDVEIEGKGFTFVENKLKLTEKDYNFTISCKEDVALTKISGAYADFIVTAKLL